MKVGAKQFFLLLFLLIYNSSFAKERNLQDELQKDFLNVFRIYNENYAPLHWKENRYRFLLNDKKSDFLNKIANCPDVASGRSILKDFLATFSDYHVSIHFTAEEKATLPFEIRPCGDKYFISWINEDKLGGSRSSISVGDEIVSFNGRPIHEVIEDFRKEESFNDTPTGRALASSFFTMRFAALGQKIPQGPVLVSVSSYEGQEKTVQLIWEYVPEGIPYPHLSPLALSTLKSNFISLNREEKKPRVRPPFKAPSYKKSKMKADLEPFVAGTKECLLAPFYKLKTETPRLHGIGEKRGFLPAIGPVFWEADASFPYDAYIFSIEENRLIGYLRIPHYMGGEDEIQAFAELIAFLEERTDALVIDQLHNPGGSVFYLYALASFFADRPFETPLHQVALTSGDIQFVSFMKRILDRVKDDADADALFGSTVDGYPVNFQFVRFLYDYCRFLINSWQNGAFLTKPTYLYGVHAINPHPQTRYTKPVLLLIDELDFSGGDFFPAIMQDNGRAVLFGERTAGAGGFVRAGSFPNLLGISHFSWTGSLAIRPGGERIEDLGVQPDIPYSLTERDLKYDYEDYIKAVRKTILDFFSKPKEEPVSNDEANVVFAS